MSLPDFVWEDLQSSTDTCFTLQTNYSPDEKDLEQIVSILNSKKDITTLKLINCDLDDQKVECLTKLQWVTHLDLSNNDIKDPSLLLLKISDLQSLTLDTNNLSADSLHHITTDATLLKRVRSIKLSAECNKYWEGYEKAIEDADTSLNSSFFQSRSGASVSVTEVRPISDSDTEDLLNSSSSSDSGSSDNDSSDEEKIVPKERGKSVPDHPKMRICVS